eukprot:TRINITY_DN2657_c0_g1_i1.p1 TRINITY_DN2657_c0_g1~~TRINITY_DN2657_c0_g1_i1.p1  ORF type:complete len:264 (+),score=50.30 TRINITY_DN2657_c0_g1_i1:114-905(+)
MKQHCYICGKEVLLSYPSHPKLHALCISDQLKLKQKSLDQISRTCTICNEFINIVYPGTRTHGACLYSWKKEHPGEEYYEDSIQTVATRDEIIQEFMLNPIFKDPPFVEETVNNDDVNDGHFGSNDGSTSSNSGNIPRDNYFDINDVHSILTHITNTENYYRVLGVPTDCDEDLLKHNYRKIALKIHPDKCSDERAEEGFKAISVAYACLSDVELRREYDLFGKAAVENDSFRRGAQVSADMKIWVLMQLYKSLTDTLFPAFR